MAQVAAAAAPVAPTTAAAQPGAPQFASLYVGDLDPEVTEAMLYEIFNTVGPVASIRVCRDSVTRRSLGYAYVNFHSATDAERVMDTLNYSTIKGRCCRIMWSHRDPNLRKTGNGNVFVKNLDKNVDNKALYDTFSLFGNILSCKVATDPADGKSRGYGFVHYETAEAAKQAIEKVNGMQIGEKMVYVGEFIPRDGRDPAEIVNFTNLYLKNFPNEWDEEKVSEEFKKFGTITSTMLQKDKLGRSFAFINYENSDAAKEAVAEFHNKDLRSDEEKEKYPDGKPKEVSEEDHKIIPADDHPEHLCYCQRAQTKAERENALKQKFSKLSPVQQIGVNLYIKNLSDDVDDDGLRKMFETYGEIASAHVMMDGKQRSKGFGFVSFKTPDEATKAVTEMHLKVVKGKPLYVGLAEKKEERTTRLASRYKGSEKGVKGGLVTFNTGKGGDGMQPGGQFGKGQMQQNPYGGMQKGAPMMPQGVQMMPQSQQQMFPPNMMMQQPPRNMMMQQQRPPMMGYPMNPMTAAAAMQKGGPQQQMAMQQQMMQQQMKGGPQQMAMQQQMKGGNPMMMQQQMKGGNPMMMKGGPQQMGQNPQQMPGRPQGPQPGANMMGRNPDQQLTAQMLANAPPGMQKQMLGEKLYPAVSRLQPELAGKITGMMLEMDNSELLLMLDSEAQLRQKVDEAMRVLSTMQQNK